MGFRDSLHYSGIALQFFGMSALVPLIAAFAYGETGQVVPFLITSLACMTMGAIADSISHWHAEPSFRTTCFVMVTLVILVSLAGSIPFIMNSGLLFDPGSQFLDSVFESVSAVTTTGFSLISVQENAPKTVVFWRSLMQWVGAMGIVVIFYTFFLSHGRSVVSAASLSGVEHIKPNLRHSAKLIFKLYLAYSAIIFASFMAAGISAFDAAIHTMSGIATGGFSDRTYMTVFPPPFFIILAAALVIGSVSFVVHDSLRNLRLRAVAANSELRLFLLLIAAGSVVIFADVGSWGAAVFHAISASSTGGYAFLDLRTLSELSKITLALLMFIGGCYTSTAGGLKVVRLRVILGSVKWMIKKILMPSRAVIPLRVGKKSLFENEVLTVYTIAFLYAITLAIGTLMLAFLGYGAADSLFESTSAITTSGLSVGIANPSAPLAVKLVLMAEMLLGRIEIIPLLVILVSRIEPQTRKREGEDYFPFLPKSSR